MVNEISYADEAPPLVFVNIGWMKRYQKPDEDDPTIGGHGYLKTHSFGYESWNFKITDDWLYGYVPRSARINIQRLGRTKKIQFLSGVTVIWIARNPDTRQTKVVGWYRDATIYHSNEHFKISRMKGVTVAYQIRTLATNAVLLLPDQRVLDVPTRKKKGNLGQSPVWYGNPEFNGKVRNFIYRYEIQRTQERGRSINATRPRQADPISRQLVELAAVEHAINYYKSDEGGNCLVNSVEADRVGWDLTVTAKDKVLKVEVKGLSGSDLCVELTPNEYQKMCSEEHRYHYIIYIVTEAISPQAKAHIFYCDAEQSHAEEHVWRAQDGRRLQIKPITGAQLTAPM